MRWAPGETDAAIRAANDLIVTALRDAPGFKGVQLLFNAKSGEGLATTLWATEADMLAAEQDANRLREQAAVMSGGTILSVERYEVALPLTL